MSLRRISAGSPEAAYKAFMDAFAEHEKAKRPLLAYFYGGQDDNSVWCNWCKAADPYFHAYAEKSGLDVYFVGVGSEVEWKKTDAKGDRENPFFRRFPYVLAVPTLIVAANYHNGFRVAARISIPEDPSQLDFGRIVSLFVE